MRISDWSSDVCASDLGNSTLALNHRRVNVFRIQGQRECRGDVHSDLLSKRLQYVSRRLAFKRNQDADFAQARRSGIVDVVDYQALIHRHMGNAAQRLVLADGRDVIGERSEEHTSELQSLMRISYAVFCLKK